MLPDSGDEAASQSNGGSTDTATPDPGTETSSATETATDSPPPETTTSTTATPSSPGGATTAAGTVRLHVVDVGQGSAAVLEYGEDDVLVFDAANRFQSTYGPLLDVLDSMDPPDVDWLITSHPDADHSGGCQHVFADHDVLNFAHPGVTHDTATWRSCLDAASNEGSTIHTGATFSPGDQVTLAPDVSLTWLHGKTTGESNTASIALRIDHGGASLIMVGDLPCSEEDQVIATGLDLDVDLLEVGHHGSSSSTCTAWLDATTPEMGYISAGEGNQYGHPTPEVLDRLTTHGVEVYRTDEAGTMTFESDGDSWSTSSQPSIPGSAPVAPDVKIKGVNADSPGDDVGHEYVELENLGDQAQDLLDWTLSDAAGAQYMFPAYGLDPGATVRVYTGCGSHGDQLCWDRGAAVWNNGGDTATLRDDAGALVDEYSYP